MDKNPVFESSTTLGNDIPKRTPGKKISGRTCALATFATLIVLAALVGVIAIIVFRPTTTETKTETVVSSDQVEVIEQEMKNLRELVSQQIELQATKCSEGINALQLQANNSKELTEQEMKNLRDLVNEQATKHASNISSLEDFHGNAIQEVQQRLNQTILETQQQLSSSSQELRNQLHNANQTIQHLQQQLSGSNQTIQSMQQKLGQLTVTDQNIDAKIDNTTQMSNQRYLDCKQTVVSLNEQTQRNVSQQIELQATKCSEGINALQLQANNSKELTEQEMKNLRELVNEQATKHASNISSLEDFHGNAIQEVQQRLNQTILETQQQVSSSNQELRNQLHNTNQTIQHLQQQLSGSNQTIQSMQQKLGQLTVTDQNIDAKIDNTTQISNQRYLDCKQTVVSLNEQTQRNVSQQIELQATKCSEGINALQLQVNNSNTAIQMVQMDIENLDSNLTETGTTKINELNTTDTDQRALTCEGLSPPTNGGVNVHAGPNSLTNGLGSVATYSCDPGYALVGQRTRTCQDNNGGTVTMGTWSGAPPLCQAIHCLGLATPSNGNVVLSDSALLLGTVATYNCSQGYNLVGDTTRTCMERSDRTIGTWSATMPRCEVIIRCQPLTQPSNGVVSISTGTHGVNLGVGAIATYSCNTSYGLVGQVSRTCVSGGGTTGTWSGSQPTCEEILTCPSISPPTNGAITFTPGADNSNIGLGSMATYSCNLGYVLVGQTTRECQSLFGGAAAWSGNPTICKDAVYCPVLTAPGNGSVTVRSGFNPLSVGSVATYSCDPGYALLGTTTRNCADPDSDSVGTWTGAMPECKVILCAELTVPENGTLVISSTLLGVGTTANYTCNQSHVLVGDVIRTCQDTSGGTVTIGTWSGSDPECAVPNRAMIDCKDTACRYKQLVCPEQDNCTVGCYDSRSYACFQTDVYCPSGRGDCTLNCDDSYACLQANTTCPQGDCILNCLNDYTCLRSAFECSGDNCIFNCQRRESCSNSKMKCTSENCTINCIGSQSCNNLIATECSGDNCLYNCAGSSSCNSMTTECSGDNCLVDCGSSYSCQRSTIQCTSGNCTVSGRGQYSLQSSTVSCPPDGLCVVNCTEHYACQSSRLTCPSGGNCVFNFHSIYNKYSIGRYATISCQENSTCSIYCGTSSYYQCRNSRITCPSESGDCSVECSGYWSCQSSTIVCGRGRECLSCSGQYSCYRATITLPNIDRARLSCTGSSSCRYARITCPINNDCAINCSSQSSCYDATITLPNTETGTLSCTGQSSCSSATITLPNIDTASLNCTGESTCQSSRITCRNNNCTIHCDGQYSCKNARVTCPTGDHSCNILCTDPLSCQGLSITNTHNVYLQCCGGLSCAGNIVTPSSTECPYIQ